MTKYHMMLFFSLITLVIVPTISFAQEDLNEQLHDSVLITDEIPNESKIEEPIIIVASNIKNRFVLDGIWSDDIEWKESSYSAWTFYDGSIAILRSAHQDSEIYFLVDFISDRTISTNMDRAMICLEGENKKNLIADENTYCFLSTMNAKNPIVLQGGGLSILSSNFNKIPNLDVKIIGGVSNYKDRYSQVPHTSYEFVIPTDLVGRYNEYGIYLAIYDFDSNKLYSWPRNIELENNFMIPSPSKWGTIISPDKSLPEFEFPLLLFVMSLITVIYFSSKKIAHLPLMKFD